MIGKGARREALRRTAAAALIAVSTGLAAGCRSERASRVLPSEGSRSAAPPVVLISLDTVRLDAVSDPSLAPNLTRFAAESVSFSGAYTEMPFTLTAHATLLTGLAPDVHGVIAPRSRLGAEWTTLAQVLRRAGYGTTAVVANDWLDPRFGFDRGFDDYVMVGAALVTSDEVTRRSLEALDRILSAGKPPFLFTHYYDAHSDFDREGNTRPYVASAEPETACRREWCTPDGECATGFLLWANRHPEEVSAVERDCLSQAYRAGVRDLDAAFGRLRQALMERGLWGPALVVVVSDHGEEFGEHGQFIHAQTFDETVSIPLWIKLPEGGAPRRIGTPAQLADVLPTILGLLDLPIEDPITGHDLLAVRADETPRVVVSQNKYRPARYAAQRGRWKLIHDVGRDRSWLFDRESDPGEQVDVAAANPDTVEELRRALEARRALFARIASRAVVDAAASDEVLDDEALQRLRSLGYVD